MMSTMWVRFSRIVEKCSVIFSIMREFYSRIVEDFFHLLKVSLQFHNFFLVFACMINRLYKSNSNAIALLLKSHISIQTWAWYFRKGDWIQNSPQIFSCRTKSALVTTFGLLLLLLLSVISKCVLCNEPSSCIDLALLSISIASY